MYQSVKFTVMRFLEVHSYLELANSVAWILILFIVLAKYLLKKISRKEGMQNLSCCHLLGDYVEFIQYQVIIRLFVLQNSKFAQVGKRAVDQLLAWGFACSSEEVLSLCLCLNHLTFLRVWYLSNSSASGIVVLCVDLLGGVGGVGRYRTGISENAFGFVVAVLLPGI